MTRPQWRLAVMTLGLATAAAQCNLEWQEFEGGLRCAVVENPYFRMVVTPDEGGAVRELFYKKTGEHLTTHGREQMMFKVFPQGHWHQFVGVEYDCEVVRNGPEMVQLRLRRRGAKGALQWTTITRTFTVWADKCLVRCESEFSNLHGALGEYDVLVLPLSLAVSNREPDHIEAFAENGGLVVADAPPGLFDEHCTWRPNGRLDRVFGVACSPEDQRLPLPVAGMLKLESNFGACKLAGIEFYASALAPQLQLSEARALGRLEGNPVFTLVKQGAGHAVCLNTLVTSYPNARKRRREKPIFSAVRGVFSLAELPEGPQTFAHGESVAGCSRAVWQDGRATYLGLFPDAEPKEARDAEAQVRFARDGHLNDVLAGKGLGRGREASVRLRPAAA